MLLYQEIRQYLLDCIQQGSLPKAGKLPSERTLQEQFDSTRITVREALMRLEAEGLIYRQNRKGWFVSPARLKWNPIHKVNFYQLAKSQGFEAQTKVVDFTKTKASGELVDLIGEQTECFTFTRVRSLNGRAVLAEQIFCPVDVCPTLGDHDLTGSITSIVLEHGGKEVDHEHSSIYVTSLSDEHAKLLEQNSGAPCLRILRRRCGANGELIDYNIEYWLHSAIEMEVVGY